MNTPTSNDPGMDDYRKQAEGMLSLGLREAQVIEKLKARGLDELVARQIMADIKTQRLHQANQNQTTQNQAAQSPAPSDGRSTRRLIFFFLAVGLLILRVILLMSR